MGGKVRGRALAGRYGRGRFVGPDLSAGGVAPPPAPSCTITLTGDFAAALGGSPATIVGQTVSGAGAGAWIGTTDLSAPTPLWGSGIRWIELHDYSVTDAYVRAGFGRPDTGVIYGIWWDGTDRFVRLVGPGETIIANAALTDVTDDLAIGVDSDGSCWVSNGDVSVKLSGDFEGAFSGASIAIAAVIVGGAPTSAGSISIRTSGESFTTSGYFTGDKDWCDDQLPVPEMTAGYYTQTIGEQTVEFFGYGVDPSVIGTLSGNPLPGFSVKQIGITLLDDVEVLRGVQFSGDATSALSGKNVYVDGVECPIASATYYSGTSYTEVLIPTLPTFTEGVTYTVEFK